MADRADELTVLRQAYVLLALAKTFTRDAESDRTGGVRELFRSARKAMEGCCAAIIAYDAELVPWAEDVDYDFKLQSGIAFTRGNMFASPLAQMNADAYVLSRKDRDELEAAAVGTPAAWRSVRARPSERLLAVLDAARSCAEAPAKLLAENKVFGSQGVWDCLDGVGGFLGDILDVRPRLLDAKTRWTAFFASFVDEARQLPNVGRTPYETVPHALTYGRLYPVKLADLPRLFGVSADALRSSVEDLPRSRGSLTIDLLQRALQLERVRLHVPEPVKTTSLDGARFILYKGRHPLLDAPPDALVIGHADYDLAATERAAWEPRADARSLVPARTLALIAAEPLGVDRVECVPIRAVAIRVGERVLGVRVMIEFLSAREATTVQA